MTFTMSELKDSVLAHIGSHGTPDRAGGIQPAQFDLIIQDAVRLYSFHRPDIGYVTQTGDGTTYEWTVPEDWDEQFSSIASVEYPAGSRDPQYMDATSVLIYEDDSNQFYFRLTGTTPSGSQTIRFAYTRQRSIDDTTTTIPDSDKEAVMHLVSYHYLRRLAAEMAKAVVSSNRDDPVDLQGKAANYISLANMEYREYTRLMGIQEDEVLPIVAIATISNPMSWGTGPLTHESGSYRIAPR